MKNSTQPRNGMLRENEQKPTPRKPKILKENSDPNLASPAMVAGKVSPAAKLRSPLPPRPPSSVKRKLASLESGPENMPLSCPDSGVKVVVRMRPPINDEQGGDLIVEKMSSDSLSIQGQTFTFDSVADTISSQQDIFQLVGAPLVENCLAGFNSSVFAYGQTGSGKTYTMWGPANALLEENLSSEQQGLTPRVFERLFARINEEQIKHADNQLVYQCRCSFLEIYNEQITDLLDSSQRNLQIREDVKSGVYVENLTEECVSTMKDVTHLLMKGLSNRRTGATTVNAESSRSHSVFTCVVESRCKSVADGLSSFKTSRINLVDLAGSERQKLTGAAGERLKEAGNINRSLSQLGNLINILAEVSQTGKHRHIPYRDSRLTFLLQESLGGNAKLAMVCAISPSQSCKSETLSTLRFAQRAKAIKNKAVVNEVMQDDVKFLRGVIRQLKDELLKMKENGTQTDSAGGYSTGWNARRSLNLLKFSMNRPTTLPHVDDDSDEEMEIVEEANQLLVQLGDNGSTTTVNLETEQGLKDTDVIMEEEISEEVDKHGMVAVDCGESTQTLEPSEDHALSNRNQSEGNYEDKCIYSQGKQVDKDSPGNQIQQHFSISSTNMLDGETLRKSTVLVIQNDTLATPVNSSRDSHGLSPSPSKASPILKSPTPSVSPRVNSSTRSLRTSSIRDENNLGPEPACSSFANASKVVYSHSTQRSTSCLPPTEHLAASLHKGLEIFENHCQSTALRRSSFRFSYKPADVKPIFPINKVDVGVQTLPQESELVDEDSQLFLCTRCKTLSYQEELKDADENSGLQLVPVAGSASEEKMKMLVPKAVEKVLAGAFRREMALEEFCNKQNFEIMQLNRLVQQYKHERECNMIIGQTREDKIARLESLMDGILTTEDFVEDELVSIKNEHKCLKEKYENHPEVLRAKLELKRVQDELDQYRSFFDMGERDVLLEEIQDLRSQLQCYVDSSAKSTRIQTPLLQLTYPHESSEAPVTCITPESIENSLEQRLEQERLLWEEAESKWISLAESLKIDLEASRSLSEKLKRELDSEKKCSEELKEAMQLAMEGHARMLEQYADLEERHMQLLARHRKIQEGIDDVKKAASRAGVRGAESKFINALAAEISALKVEREKERCYLRDENKGLQAQLRDTAEAVQAAGELLVRLKEAEEALAVFQNRAMEAEHETEKAYKQINKLKRKHEKEINSLNELLEESRLPAKRQAYDDSHAVKYDASESPNKDDQQWREEFRPFNNIEECELSKLAEPSSWFSGYDRCNI